MGRAGRSRLFYRSVLTNCFQQMILCSPALRKVHLFPLFKVFKSDWQDLDLLGVLEELKFIRMVPGEQCVMMTGT